MKSVEFKKVLSSGIIGTSAMTIFSYLVSELMKDNFREPEIQTYLIKNILPTAGHSASIPFHSVQGVVLRMGWDRSYRST